MIPKWKMFFEVMLKCRISFEELKNRCNDLSHQFAVLVDERDNLREALNRITSSHQEAPNFQVECGGFAPHHLEGLAKVGASSSSKVPALFPQFPKDLISGLPRRVKNHRVIQLRLMVLQAMMQFQLCRNKFKISWMR